MKVNDWLAVASQQLEAAGISTARLDALVLLEDVTEMARARLLAEPELELTASQLTKLTNLLKRRATHEPLAYLRSRTEFYGREFVIGPAVLEPRPESEAMIDCLKDIVKQADFSHKSGTPLAIADVGTGSGALGITAQLELASLGFNVKNLVVDLLEIDPEACKIAKMNVDIFTINVSVIKSDLLAAAPRTYDILLCNLPYVPDAYKINTAALHEPRLAIFGGPDGLAVYQQLFEQIANLLKRPLYILTEALPPQHDSLSQIAAGSEYRLARTEDFIQVFRDNRD